MRRLEARGLLERRGAERPVAQLAIARELGQQRRAHVVERHGTQLVLEPDEHPAAKPFKKALVADGIPFTSFAVDDVRAEHERLRGLGVRFTQEPADMGPVTTAVLDDTCGNLIQIAQTR